MITPAMMPAANSPLRDGAPFVQRFAAFWSSPRTVPLSTLLTPDVRLEQPLMRATIGLSAAEAWRLQLLDTLPTLRADVESWSASGDIVFIAFRLHATEPTFELEWSAVDRFQLRSGLACERVSYFDGLELLRQVARQPRTWLRFLRWARGAWQGAQ